MNKHNLLPPKLLAFSRLLLLVMADALCVLCSGGLALLVRFDFNFDDAILKPYMEAWAQFLPLQLFATLAVFVVMRMYRYVWRSVSTNDVMRMAFSVVIAYAVSISICYAWGYKQPRSVLLMQFVFELFLLVGIRCLLRFWEALKMLMRRSRGSYDERIMLIGAGDAGRMLARELLGSAKLNVKLCCVIDDNPSKWGKYLENIPIVGGRDMIPTAARSEAVTQIIFAIPTASARERMEILNICNRTGIRTRTLPGIYQLVNGEATLSNVKDVQVEDLLGRAPVHLSPAALDGFLGGKTVLVTGGGGSIGSELCRQIARYAPETLIVLDIYENNAYDIQQELLRTCGDRLNLEVIIASVRDKERIYSVFEAYRPDVVFHAAAHKHVPLMESSPAEAVKNNVFGTYHVVRAAEKFGVKKFVMISSDKAVNPTNVMGATKRFCEMILQSRSGSPTEFSSVRFGNVLDSNGSVVPLFRRQIEAGGPVTVTDREIFRYFMTIPEAAQLVLEAGAMARQSQIFVLDMGEPVRILDLAEKMIRLSGLEPYRDIEIREIGLRPGEKLVEELLMRSEALTKTDNAKIFIEQQQAMDPAKIMEDLQALDRAVSEDYTDAELVALLRTIVPTYRAPEEVNGNGLPHPGFLPTGGEK